MQQSIVIRDINSAREMRLVEELQKDVWGIPDIEVVPTSQFMAAIHAGGVLLGAFDGEVLAGFAYGFVAKEDGKIAHHSHMVGVQKKYRSLDLGFRLKAAQRERVLGQGIQLMSWTFDPLQSLNAYFNFAKLGVVARSYFVDFYGSEAASFLHQNGTDRLWVTWELTNDRVIERLRKEERSETAIPSSVLVEYGENGVPIEHDFDSGLAGDSALIEIPIEIASIEARDVQLAAKWRHATRKAFTSAIEKGFFVEDFCRSDRSRPSVGVYCLRKISTS